MSSSVKYASTPMARERPCRHIVKFVIAPGFLRPLGFVLFTQFILPFQEFKVLRSRPPAMPSPSAVRLRGVTRKDPAMFSPADRHSLFLRRLRNLPDFDPVFQQYRDEGGRRLRILAGNQKIFTTQTVESCFEEIPVITQPGLAIRGCNLHRCEVRRKMLRDGAAKRQ